MMSDDDAKTRTRDKVEVGFDFLEGVRVVFTLV